MNNDILKSVLADNQNEVPRHEVIPRNEGSCQIVLFLRLQASDDYNKG